MSGHVQTVQNPLENILVYLKNREVCEIVRMIQTPDRGHSIPGDWKHANMSIYVRTWGETPRRSAKTNRRLDLSSSEMIDTTSGHRTHTNTHSHSHRKSGVSVSDRLGRCSRELRQENSSKLKRQESEKQDTWEEGKWRGKTRSSHVGISVGKTWSLKTATAQGCLMFVVLDSHHRGRVQFSLGSPF